MSVDMPPFIGAEVSTERTNSASPLSSLDGRIDQGHWRIGRGSTASRAAAWPSRKIICFISASYQELNYSRTQFHRPNTKTFCLVLIGCRTVCQFLRLAAF